MEKKPIQYITEHLIKFGRAFQLPEPPAEYIDAIYNALHAEKTKWTIKEFVNILALLLKDEKYAESARFGKYPLIYDFLRIRKQMQSKPFYDALAAYLDGCWWEKESILAMATPQQRNALTMAGGLQRLFERANDKDMPTQISKLVDLVSSYEAEAPAEIIDTQHRLEAPKTMETFLTDLTKNKGVKNDEEEKNN